MNIEAPVEPQRVFSDSKLATHMPFFDGTTLLFCQGGPPLERTIPATGSIWKTMRRNQALAARLKNLPRSHQLRYRPWKLAFCDWNDKIVHSIATGLPENGIECSPAFYKDSDRVHLSFIGGEPSDAGFHYRLYVSSGPDLEHLEPAKPLPNGPVYFGFVSPHHVCWGIRSTVNLTEKVSGNILRFKTNFVSIRRVTFLAENPAKLLITGLDQARKYRTVLHDLSSGATSDVSAEGPVYKSTLSGERIVHTELRRDGFENRELCHGNYTLSPSTIKISQE